jgi:osmotically inducible lipoprotein OsmB
MKTTKILITLIAASSLGACANWSGAEKGAAIGAGTGALVGGAATGGSAIGVVGGAAVGGVIGHEVGKNNDRR